MQTDSYTAIPILETTHTMHHRLRVRKEDLEAGCYFRIKSLVKVSSLTGNFVAENLLDENVKTFWVAAKNDDEQWIEIDLLTPCIGICYSSKLQ